jgi:hypothetical protein
MGIFALPLIEWIIIIDTCGCYSITMEMETPSLHPNGFKKKKGYKNNLNELHRVQKKAEELLLLRKFDEAINLCTKTLLSMSEPVEIGFVNDDTQNDKESKKLRLFHQLKNRVRKVARLRVEFHAISLS